MHLYSPPRPQRLLAAVSNTSWGLTKWALGPLHCLHYLLYFKYLRNSYISITRKQSSKYLVRTKIHPSSL